jgi:hypothetical protein
MPIMASPPFTAAAVMLAKRPPQQSVARVEECGTAAVRNRRNVAAERQELARAGLGERQVLGPAKKLIAQTWLGGIHCGASRCGAGATGIFITYGGSYRFNLDWQRWIEEAIADELLVATLGKANTTTEVRKFLKSKLTKGCAIFMRKPNIRELLSVVRAELQQVSCGRSGRLRRA